MDPQGPRLAVAPGVDVPRGATDAPRVARVSAQGATPCAERRKQLPLLGSVRLGLSRAVVRVTLIFCSAHSAWRGFALVIGELLNDAAARNHLPPIRCPLPHRRLWTKASRLMLQLTRSTVEGSAGIIVKPPPQSRMLSRTDREPNERLGR